MLESELKTEAVVPGSLVAVLQKGMQYMDVEQHITEVKISVILQVQVGVLFVRYFDSLEHGL